MWAMVKSALSPRVLSCRAHVIAYLGIVLLGVELGPSSPNALQEPSYEPCPTGRLPTSPKIARCCDGGIFSKGSLLLVEHCWSCTPGFIYVGSIVGL